MRMGTLLAVIEQLFSVVKITTEEQILFAAVH